jgi:molybdenum cofactor cytidylyltransferase
MVRCVILAAGASSRMGRAKAALPLGTGETFLSHIVKTMSAAGLSDIVIVSGANPEATRAACPPSSRVQLVHNPRWQTGQLSSLLTGLDVPASTPIEAAIVALIDVPLVSAQTVRALVGAWRESRAPIVRPARGHEHGHPVIFDAAVFEELRRADLDVGAKAVVRAHETEILNLAVEDPGAYQDIDTPEDYARLSISR